ncbi:MAG: endolytic transglycosylase MltG [Candidatus Acidiferrales bacterium]
MRRLGLLALLVIAAMGAAAGWLDSQISRPYRGHRPEKVFVDIPHGTSRWGVSGILVQNDIIRSRLAFALFSYWHHRRPPQAGEYYFDRSFDSREVFWKIAEGKIFLHTVTVPEGWTMYDIAGELDRQGICARDVFLQAAGDPTSIKDLAPKAQSLEGFLFPSTYQFSRHISCAQIADTMIRHFRAVWLTLNPSSSDKFPKGLTLEQVVTLSSLVERETPNPVERPLVAGVFYNRLRLGYQLQCDPTVQYAMELAGHREKTVRPADLRIDSPYNTYAHRGLPPGPIANPGEASLRAALEPAQTDYLYFVANDQGGHFFSKTLAEHNRNVVRYRRLLAGDAPPPEAEPKKPKHRRPS